MSRQLFEQLQRELKKIDRPGSFCTSGSGPVVLPGLKVTDLGPIGLPLTPSQAADLKKHCEQAPYGKGEQTLVDTSVRRVWQLKPDRFQITNPAWPAYLDETLARVQAGLGLEKLKLQAHLYDLLLYEPGSFFLPHRDGEKLDRMVATLVIVLPSDFAGGELVVRHDGQEETIDLGGAESAFRTSYAAFYADCEHEVRPLSSGHRLCLVYNLTLTKGTKGLSAPTTGQYVEPIAQLLREWAASPEAKRLVVTLEHQYTQDGLIWDALKGTDRVKANVLEAAAKQAGCQVHLALLTFHETGGAEYAGSRRRGRYYDDESDNASDYQMGEVIESELSAEHWSNSANEREPFGYISIDDEELIDPDALESVQPEVEFEGYTGNAGMTLDHWYRHAALFVWPDDRHFEVLCDAGLYAAVPMLLQMAKRWQRSKKDTALQAQCVDFAGRIIGHWPTLEYSYGGSAGDGIGSQLLEALAILDDAELIGKYVSELPAKDASVQPGAALAKVCERHGWATFREPLQALFNATTVVTLERNLGILESLCQAQPRKKDGWLDLCQALAASLFRVLEGLDKATATNDWRVQRLDRIALLPALVRSLLATEQEDLLARLFAHVEADRLHYPPEGQVAALVGLKAWLKKNQQTPSPALTSWVAASRAYLGSITAQIPKPPTDQRREAPIACKCADCGQVIRFLQDATQVTFRLSAAQGRRSHVEQSARAADLDFRTEEKGRPYTLILTKNIASYERALKKYHKDRGHLAVVQAIETDLPQGEKK